MAPNLWGLVLLWQYIWDPRYLSDHCGCVIWSQNCIAFPEIRYHLTRRQILNQNSIDELLKLCSKWNWWNWMDLKQSNLNFGLWDKMISCVNAPNRSKLRSGNRLSEVISNWKSYWKSQQTKVLRAIEKSTAEMKRCKL